MWGKVSQILGVDHNYPQGKRRDVYVCVCVYNFTERRLICLIHCKMGRDNRAPSLLTYLTRFIHIPTDPTDST